MVSDDMIRISLQLDPDGWHGLKSEGIWVKAVKKLAGKMIVEVDNIPWFTRHLSCYDKITVALINGELVLQEIVERGGHSTYRVYIREMNDEKLQRLAEIKNLGCDWERGEFGGGQLYAIDIPPNVDINELYRLLQNGQIDGSWLFEEGFVGHHLEGDPIPTVS